MKKDGKVVVRCANRNHQIIVAGDAMGGRELFLQVKAVDGALLLTQAEVKRLIKALLNFL
jgi:hypothetical protein